MKRAGGCALVALVVSCGATEAQPSAPSDHDGGVKVGGGAEGSGACAAQSAVATCFQADAPAEAVKLTLTIVERGAFARDWTRVDIRGTGGCIRVFQDVLGRTGDKLGYVDGGDVPTRELVELDTARDVLGFIIDRAGDSPGDPIAGLAGELHADLVIDIYDGTCDRTGPGHGKRRVVLARGAPAPTWARFTDETPALGRRIAAPISTSSPAATASASSGPVTGSPSSPGAADAGSAPAGASDAGAGATDGGAEAGAAPNDAGAMSSDAGARRGGAGDAGTRGVPRPPGSSGRR